MVIGASGSHYKLCTLDYLLLGLIYWPKNISSLYKFFNFCCFFLFFFHEWWIDLFGCTSTKLELDTRQAIDESKKKVLLSFALMLHQNVIIVYVASTDEQYGNIISDSSHWWASKLLHHCYLLGRMKKKIQEKYAKFEHSNNVIRKITITNVQFLLMVWCDGSAAYVWLANVILREDHIE